MKIDITDYVRRGKSDEILKMLKDAETEIQKEKEKAAQEAEARKQKKEKIAKAEDKLVKALIEYYAAKGYPITEKDTDIMKKILNSSFEMPDDTFFDWFFTK